MFGVSPKFFVVRCGENFTVDDYINTLERLPSLSLTNFQGEIFKEVQLEDWEENAPRLEEKASQLNLRQDMFVAHFLIEGSSSFDKISDGRYEKLFDRVLDMLSAFPSLKIVCVPIGRYIDDGKNDRDKAKELLSRRLVCYSEKAGAKGLNFAVEVISGALLDYRELAIIKEKNSLDNFGLNLDTGHANLIMHENISLIPSFLKVFGTHIKDNDGINADELKPGDGCIDWPKLISSLETSGYSGSYDFELSSSDDKEYLMAEDYLKQFINKNKTGGN